jgi:hypothetical protein
MFCFFTVETPHAKERVQGLVGGVVDQNHMSLARLPAAYYYKTMTVQVKLRDLVNPLLLLLVIFAQGQSEVVQTLVLLLADHGHASAQLRVFVVDRSLSLALAPAVNALV